MSIAPYLRVAAVALAGILGLVLLTRENAAIRGSTSVFTTGTGRAIMGGTLRNATRPLPASSTVPPAGGALPAGSQPEGSPRPSTAPVEAPPPTPLPTPSPTPGQGRVCVLAGLCIHDVEGSLTLDTSAGPGGAARLEEGIGTTVEDACDAVERRMHRAVAAGCSGEAPPALDLERSAARDFRLLGGSPGEGAAHLALTVSGQAGCRGGDWLSLFVHSIDEGPLVQVAGRVVDAFDGSYGVFFTLPRPGDYAALLTHDYASCTGYRLRTQREAGFLGKVAMRFKVSHAAAEPLPPATGAARHLADTGFWSGPRWHPAPTQCAPATFAGRLPRNVVFAGDSTTGQISTCLFAPGRDAAAIPAGARADAQRPCEQVRWAAAHPPEGLSEGDRSALATVRAMVGEAFEHCYAGPHENPGARDFCMLTIMGRDTPPSTWSERVVERFVDLDDGTVPPATMVISESAHIQNTYSLGDFQAKLGKILALVKPAERPFLRRGSAVVWREAWSINEYTIYDTPYSPDAPAKDKAKVAKSGVAKRLSDPQAALHNSLVLDRLVLASGGAVGMVPAYWSSKAWFKTLDKPGVGCLFEPCASVTLSGRYFDMRHGQAHLLAATVLGIAEYIGRT